MKRLWIGALMAAGVMAGASAVFAQDEPPPPAPGMSEETTTTTWTVRPAERQVIHDYVIKEKIRPERVRAEVAVGAPVPEDVQLQPVPEEIYTSVPEARRYEYFDWDGRMVFVDPDSRKVVQIVD